MRIGDREFKTKGHTYIMGILNVTPDSFSDGGKYTDSDRALFHAEQMICDGADVIDVGGESTRPGYEKISEQEEIERIVPVIEKLKENFSVPISLDTYKSQVARAGIAAGADLINDIWGLKYDPDMGSVIADGRVACCLMHNRAKAEYEDFRKELLSDLRSIVDQARRAGIDESRILLDPGVGFGKSYAMNLQIIHYLEEAGSLGYPILLGASRKSVIGQTLNVPADKRVTGTAVTTVFAVQKGCMFVRVHDVKENAEAIRMAEAILYS